MDRIFRGAYQRDRSNSKKEGKKVSEEVGKRCISEEEVVKASRRCEINKEEGNSELKIEPNV